MADYGARRTMLQAASTWDLIAEREEERSSNRAAHPRRSAEQVRALSIARPLNLRPRRVWIAIQSLAKLLQPQQHR